MNDQAIDYPQGWRESDLNPDQVSKLIDNRRHTLPALIEQYRAIATILARQPDTLPRLLAADYRFVAELLVLAIQRGTVSLLVRELRGNLNRRASYIQCEKRNKTLQVAAKTIERLEGKR